MRFTQSSLTGLLTLSLTLAACMPGSGGTGGTASSSVSSAHPMISVSQPLPNATVTSPLVVRGEARGPWYFEASFPVRLLDSSGNEIAVTPAQAQGEWMTMDFVPFEATLTFTTTSATGTLVLEKDNPSGEPQNADSISIPVQF